MNKILVCYIPVLHNGYYRFFGKYKGMQLNILDPESLFADFPYLKKEIRALDANLAKKAIEGWGIFKTIKVINLEKLKNLTNKNNLIMPNDDISRMLSCKYLKHVPVIFESVFLRWDRDNTVATLEVDSDLKISLEEFDKKIMKKLSIEKEKSSDWWRHVASAVVKKGKLLVYTHNKHVPSEYTPYIDGDPRNCSHKGMDIELATSLHAEAGIIVHAAKQGLSLAGSDFYSTTFPCPNCAKLIAYSGASRLFYCDGYAILDGARILKDNGVEIIKVDTDTTQS